MNNHFSKTEPGLLHPALFAFILRPLFYVFLSLFLLIPHTNSIIPAVVTAIVFHTSVVLPSAVLLLRRRLDTAVF